MIYLLSERTRNIPTFLFPRAVSATTRAKENAVYISRLESKTFTSGRIEIAKVGNFTLAVQSSVSASVYLGCLTFTLATLAAVRGTDTLCTLLCSNLQYCTQYCTVHTYVPYTCRSANLSDTIIRVSQVCTSRV